MLAWKTTRRNCAVGLQSGCRTIVALIMGPPGGGKGTISKKLVKDFGFLHVSSGDMLRAQVRAGTPLGLKAQEHMKSGSLVPDELIIDLVLGKVRSAEAKHVLLDGFPRTPPQADKLGSELPVDVALNLMAPTEEIVARTSSRWIHAASGRTYSLDWNPPNLSGKDDETGEALIQRDDDKPDAVRQRLATYDQVTLLLLEYYRSKGILAEFDGADQPDLLAKDRRSDAIYKSLKPYIERFL